MKPVELQPGQTFGLWRVVREVTQRHGQRQIEIECRCGRTATRYLADMRKGRSLMCASCSAKEGALAKETLRLIYRRTRSQWVRDLIHSRHPVLP